MSFAIIVTATSEEAKAALSIGMSAEQLKCTLFVIAKDELNNLTTHIECNYPGCSFDSAVIKRTVVDGFISSRGRRILIDNGFLDICGAGYTINKTAFDSEKIENAYAIWENWFWKHPLS